MIDVEYPNMRVVFLPDTYVTLSPLQLGVMYEFHALYLSQVILGVANVHMDVVVL